MIAEKKPEAREDFLVSIFDNSTVLWYSNDELETQKNA
jgi:hypothetical protein